MLETICPQHANLALQTWQPHHLTTFTKVQIPFSLFQQGHILGS